MNITRNQAINKLINLLVTGHSIPMCSLGNGGAGFSLIGPVIDVHNWLMICYDTENYDFNVIPMNEISEDFKANGINAADYDMCIEFKEKVEENPYREQYLLWNID